MQQLDLGYDRRRSELTIFGATHCYGDDIIGGCLHGATTPCPPDTVTKVCRDVTWGSCQPPLLPTDGPTD